MPSEHISLHEHYFHSYFMGEVAIGHHALQHLVQVLWVLHWILTQSDPKHRIWDLIARSWKRTLSQV